MLRTNLSTRPFYNERGLHAVLTVIGVLVVALTVFNIPRILVLTREERAFSARSAAAESRAATLRNQAMTVRRGVDPKELEQISAEARQANTLIGRRLFSWTDLLNRLETTLPDDVRITSMHPNIEKAGSVSVMMTVEGRRVEDINTFMERLEATGAFAEVFSREEMTTEQGLRRAVIEGQYRPK